MGVIERIASGLWGLLKCGVVSNEKASPAPDRDGRQMDRVRTIPFMDITYNLLKGLQFWGVIWDIRPVSACVLDSKKSGEMRKNAYSKKMAIGPSPLLE